MRTIGLLAVLVVGVGCADALPGDMDGTGGSGFPSRPGVGGAQAGIGGAAACDLKCQADVLWQQYLHAASASVSAEAAYQSAYADALASASATCGCTPSCTAVQYCPRDPTTTIGGLATANLAVQGADAARMKAAIASENAYAAYFHAAVAAGLAPMAKVS